MIKIMIESGPVHICSRRFDLCSGSATQFTL